MEQTTFNNSQVAAVFDSYPAKVRNKLLFLRQLIFDTAAQTPEVGKLEETLKWGEPAYLTPQTKTGSTIRINWKESLGDYIAIYFKCTTSLVPAFRKMYPTEFIYEKNRAIHFPLDSEIPQVEVRHCIKMALTYHLIKKTLKDLT